MIKSKEKCLGIKLWLLKIETMEEVEDKVEKISKNEEQNKSQSYEWKEMRYRGPMANKWVQ